MSFPASPVLNEVFIAGGKAWKFDGTNWVIPQKASTLPWELVTGKPTYFPADWSSTVANIPNYFNAKVISSEFPPTNQVTGTIWWDEVNQRLYVYQSNVWVETSVALREKFITIDPDVINYVTAVETADGAPLEQDVVTAYEAFILGCKIDGIWGEIKTGCILAGARTMAGAMVSLTGLYSPTPVSPIPTSFYNRKTGFGGTYGFNTNYPNLLNDKQNRHISIYITEPESRYEGTPDPTPDGGISEHNQFGLITNSISSYGGTIITADKNAGVYHAVVAQQGTDATRTSQPYNLPGFVGATRINSGNFTFRANATNQILNMPVRTQAMPGDNYYIKTSSGHSYGASNARIAFYSCGANLDLEKLDARVTKLMTTLSTVIP